MPTRNPGISRRLHRILPMGRGIVVPMDHGVSGGILPGLEKPDLVTAQVVDGGATAIVVHKGLVNTILESLGDAALLIHASASTSLNPDPNDKRLVATVGEAVRLGADGFSVHINVGSPTESRQVEELGRVSGQCQDYGLPLLAMMYPRGKDVKETDPRTVGHVARLGYELGADVLKVPYTGSPETFAPIVDAIDIPIIISGGPKIERDEDVLAMVHGAVRAGAAGVSIGRNVFQRPDPRGMIRAIRAILYEGKRPEEIVVQ